LLLCLYPQYWVRITCLVRGRACGDAETNYRRFIEMLFVKIRVQEMFKEFPVQIARIIRNAKFITVFIVLLKQHAKIVMAYVGGKIVSYNPLKTLVSFMINNSCFQHFDHRKDIAIICNVDVN